MSWKKYWPTNQRMDGHEPPEAFPGDKKTPSKSWRKKYECKKNKGDHTFKIVRIEGKMEYTVQTPYGIAHGSYHLKTGGRPGNIIEEGVAVDVYWECDGCKKREWERFHEKRGISFFGSWDDRLHKKMDKHRWSIYETLG